MKILFRVDSYPEIAIGHLARCINLGKTLEELGNQITIISYKDSETQARLNNSGLKFYLLDHKINNKDFIRLEKSLISKYKVDADLLIVDSYKVDSKYFNEMKFLYPIVVYLDDLGLDFNIDMVINPSCKLNSKDYIAPIALCGADYLILDSEYKLGRTKIIQDLTILITFGGIDHYDLTSTLIPLIENINNKIKLNILIGPYYDNVHQIKLAAQKSKLKINFFEGVTNISSVILKSNLAITAGGVSVYELVAMSTPSIGIALWDNQKANIECLGAHEAIIPLFYSESQEFSNELINSLEKLILHSNLQEKMSNIARSIVDGKGTERISKIINQEYGK